MEDTKKQALCQDLKALLVKWDALILSEHPNTVEYVRLRSHILELCKSLDALDEASR